MSKEPVTGSFLSVKESFGSATFKGQMIVNIIINFVINGGIQWATFSKWGGRPAKESWPDIYVWKIDDQDDVGTSMGRDLYLTAFAVGFFCSLFATGGTQKEVREKKCKTLVTDALTEGWWRFTPISIRNVCLRSLCIGAVMVATLATLFIMFLWAIVGGGAVSGFTYCLVKAFYAGFLITPAVYTFVYPAAINKANFADMEFEKLMDLAADSQRPTASMVANVARI